VAATHPSSGTWAEFLKVAGILKVGPAREPKYLGRTEHWSGFGADPYLAGEAVFETIVGIQNADVQAWYTVAFEFKNHTDCYPQHKAFHQQVRPLSYSLEWSPLMFD